jgi:hypothetical protein
MSLADSSNSITVPAVSTRRCFLSTAASVAAGSAVLALVDVTGALAAVDPIHAAIAKHKAAKVPWDAAIDIRSVFPDSAFPKTDEQWEEQDRLDDAIEAAWEPLEQASVDLINTAPTTLAGMVAAIQYLRNQMRDDGTYMTQTFVLETGGDAQNTMGWIDAWLGTIGDAAAALSFAGRAVQS